MWFLHARRFASAVYAVARWLSIRPSVCPSQVGVLPKWLNVGSRKLRYKFVELTTLTAHFSVTCIWHEASLARCAVVKPHVTMRVQNYRPTGRQIKHDCGRKCVSDWHAICLRYYYIAWQHRPKWLWLKCAMWILHVIVSFCLYFFFVCLFICSLMYIATLFGE